MICLHGVDIGDPCGSCAGKRDPRLVYCAHGVYRDQPCGMCMRGPEPHQHATLDEALGCGDCQAAARAKSTRKQENLNRRVGELEAWWLAAAQDEIERTIPKAIEYGAGDLIDLGRTMAKVLGRSDISDIEAAELGIFFYVQGKMARWTDAVAHRRAVSDDTLFDLGVYVRMAQRNRASASGWPGANLEGDNS